MLPHTNLSRMTDDRVSDLFDNFFRRPALTIHAHTMFDNSRVFMMLRDTTVEMYRKAEHSTFLLNTDNEH